MLGLRNNKSVCITVDFVSLQHRSFAGGSNDGDVLASGKAQTDLEERCRRNRVDSGTKNCCCTKTGVFGN